MGLQKYKAKRDFTQTPEPEGKLASSHQQRLHFVVQKHQASHLHYDFRLEIDGVLKSWAIPKGPSLNPNDKRLAIQVEDHPLDYRHFEGRIPEGSYGAGTVIIWDEGTYHAMQANDAQENEQQIREGLQAGHLNIILEGHKLKGAFSLIRFKKGSEKQWLLIKQQDAFTSSKDIREQEHSVRSEKTL